MQAIVKNMKKQCLFTKKNYIINTELLFNIKLLCFLEPSSIKKFYNNLEIEYAKNKDYENFFTYFNRQWLPRGKKKNIKFSPPWNYYKILKSQNFDKKHLFLTNNVSESINHILNRNFKYKYPTFMDWKNSIIQCSERLYKKDIQLQRNDYNTKIIIYFLKLLERNKKDIKLLKYDEIQKINSIILPEHDSLSISPLSEILNIKNDEEDSKENDNYIILNSLNDSDENPENNMFDEEKEEINLTLSNIDIQNDDFNDFRITIQNSINNINYSDYEKNVDKILNEV